MRFEWDEAKNQQLKSSRGICFEDVLVAISEQRLLDVLPDHNPSKYPNQRLFIIQVRGYVYFVSFVENQPVIFLKNIIPSRKYLKQFATGAGDDH